MAICAEDEIGVDDLHELVKRAYPFSDLSRQQLENVLDMLAGRYPSDEFAELRPRIVWDRTGGTIRGRSGARRLAVTNAGTIPDRGLFGVFLVEGGGRVGELDEEMVYEARAGQTFLLGASTWRIEEITRDRVLVSPAPGVPGAVPFWKGEGIGRPYELGAAIGKTSRELVALPEKKALARLQKEHCLDERAARNLVTFLSEQAEATGAVPSDRTIVIEKFRDEIGDWRVCVLTPFGARVHAPWAMAMTARLRDGAGLDAQSIWSDDGIALHFPDADQPPPIEELLIAPEQLEDLVVGELGQTALFGARFRENASRALLIPRRYPGKRTPLWQQRLKAQSLLQVARKYGSFPVILETYRECLQDVFDLPALRRLLQGIRTRELDLVEIETASASPYAASLLFDYIATYMYEDDTPAAERRAQALSLDRDLLRELLGQEELRDLLDPGAIEEVESQLRGSPKHVDGLHDLLLLRGHLFEGEYDAGFGETLRRERRAITLRIGGREALAAAEDAGRYRDAIGAMPPGGLPDAFLEPGDEPLRTLLARFARGRGPFTTAEAVERFGLAAERVEPELRELEREERLVRGELRPGGTEREWCDPEVLRRLRRASLAALRREVEPAEQAALGRFLPSWHGIDRRASLREALIPLQGVALPVALWESEVLPRRVPNYQPLQLDQLCASGELVWVGAGLDRVAVYFREDAPVLGRPGAAERPDDTAHAAIRRALGRSAEFWLDLVAATGLEAEEVLPALWDLVWAGEVTNDAWTPLRAGRRYGVPSAPRLQRRFSRRRASGTTATQGRWSVAERLFAGRPDRRALAELLLERQGIVTRDGVRAEGVPGGYGAVYGELKALETLGLCRRGYFVEGLGGAQFALGGAVERLRELRSAPEDEVDPLVLAAADPAQPYGGVAAVAEAGGRSRLARRRRAGRAAERRGRAVRRARRQDARPAARAGRGVAAACAGGARRAREARPRQAPGGRALRRPAGGRHRAHATACRGRLPGRPASRGAPPVVRFVHVRLAAGAEVLPRLVGFYGRDLGLGPAPFIVGETTIEFVPGPGEPFYHYALLVPGDRFDAAREWAGDRVDLLPGQSGNVVFAFDFWGAQACYFHDPAGNIVELIAHEGVGEAGAEGSFRLEELLGLSELGLVGDLPAMAAELAGLGLEVWSGAVTEPGSLAFVGAKARTLILAAPGRGWLPTGQPAEQHPVEAAVAASVAGEVELEGSLYRIGSALTS